MLPGLRGVEVWAWSLLRVDGQSRSKESLEQVTISRLRGATVPHTFLRAEDLQAVLPVHALDKWTEGGLGHAVAIEDVQDMLERLHERSRRQWSCSAE